MRVHDHPWRYVCLLLCVAAGVLWAGVAWAQSGPQVSTEFVYSALLTVGMAMLAAYTRGVDSRIVNVELRAEKRFDKVDGELVQQQTQLTMFHETQPSRREFDRLIATVDRLEARFDTLLGAVMRHQDQGGPR